MKPFSFSLSRDPSEPGPHSPKRGMLLSSGLLAAVVLSLGACASDGPPA
jgi:hypothetical protein